MTGPGDSDNTLTPRGQSSVPVDKSIITTVECVGAEILEEDVSFVIVGEKELLFRTQDKKEDRNIRDRLHIHHHGEINDGIVTDSEVKGVLPDDVIMSFNDSTKREKVMNTDVTVGTAIAGSEDLIQPKAKICAEDLFKQDTEKTMEPISNEISKGGISVQDIHLVEYEDSFHLNNVDEKTAVWSIITDMNELAADIIVTESSEEDSNSEDDNSSDHMFADYYFQPSDDDTIEFGDNSGMLSPIMEVSSNQGDVDMEELILQSCRGQSPSSGSEKEDMLHKKPHDEDPCFIVSGGVEIIKSLTACQKNIENDTNAPVDDQEKKKNVVHLSEYYSRRNLLPGVERIKDVNEHYDNLDEIQKDDVERSITNNVDTPESAGEISNKLINEFSTETCSLAAPSHVYNAIMQETESTKVHLATHEIVDSQSDNESANTTTIDDHTQSAKIHLISRIEDLSTHEIVDSQSDNESANTTTIDDHTQSAKIHLISRIEDLSTHEIVDSQSDNESANTTTIDDHTQSTKINLSSRIEDLATREIVDSQSDNESANTTTIDDHTQSAKIHLSSCIEDLATHEIVDSQSDNESASTTTIDDHTQSTKINLSSRIEDLATREIVDSQSDNDSANTTTIDDHTQSTKINLSSRIEDLATREIVDSQSDNDSANTTTIDDHTQSTKINLSSRIEDLATREIVDSQSDNESANTTTIDDHTQSAKIHLISRIENTISPRHPRTDGHGIDSDEDVLSNEMILSPFGFETYLFNKDPLINACVGNDIKSYTNQFQTVPPNISNEYSQPVDEISEDGLYITCSAKGQISNFHADNESFDSTDISESSITTKTEENQYAPLDTQLNQNMVHDVNICAVDNIDIGNNYTRSHEYSEMLCSEGINYCCATNKCIDNGKNERSYIESDHTITDENALQFNDSFVSNQDSHLTHRKVSCEPIVEYLRVSDNNSNSKEEHAKGHDVLETDDDATGVEPNIATTDLDVYNLVNEVKHTENFKTGEDRIIEQQENDYGILGDSRVLDYKINESQSACESRTVSYQSKSFEESEENTLKCNMKTSGTDSETVVEVETESIEHQAKECEITEACMIADGNSLQEKLREEEYERLTYQPGNSDVAQVASEHNGIVDETFQAECSEIVMKCQAVKYKNEEQNTYYDQNEASNIAELLETNTTVNTADPVKCHAVYLNTADENVLVYPEDEHIESDFFEELDQSRVYSMNSSELTTVSSAESSFSNQSLLGSHNSTQPYHMDSIDIQMKTNINIDTIGTNNKPRSTIEPNINPVDQMSSDLRRHSHSNEIFEGKLNMPGTHIQCQHENRINRTTNKTEERVSINDVLPSVKCCNIGQPTVEATSQAVLCAFESVIESANEESTPRSNHSEDLIDAKIIVPPSTNDLARPEIGIVTKPRLFPSAQHTNHVNGAVSVTEAAGTTEGEIDEAAERINGVTQDVTQHIGLRYTDTEVEICNTRRDIPADIPDITHEKREEQVSTCRIRGGVGYCRHSDSEEG